MKTTQHALTLGLWMGLAGCLTLLIQGRATADNIDRELLRQSPNVMKYLNAKGYKNVGVLTFRTQKGEAKPSFRGALINSNVADRLEQALVLAMDPERPINIISQARKTAASKISEASYRTAADRKKLFSTRYTLPLDTKDKYVTADAFIVGKVWVKPDYSKVTIAVEVFDSRAPEKVERILSFDVPSDRYVLADLGRGFSLSQRGLKFARSADDGDIIEGISDEVTSIAAGEEVSLSDYPGEFPVKLTIRYDNVEQTLEANPLEGSNNFSVKDPSEKQEVTFEVENITDERLGMVLTVNGFNTLYEETGASTALTRWVLEPHKKYQIKGIYEKDKKNYRPILGLSDEDSTNYLDIFGDDAGLIHLYVFRETGGVEDAGVPLASRGSLRPVSFKQVGTRPARTWAELQRHIASGMALKGGRGLMAVGEDLREESLTTLNLGAVHNSDTMIIRYYSVAKEYAE